MMVFHVEYARTVPERQPEGHIPAAPRFSMRWKQPVTAIVSDYFAVQAPELSWPEQARFFEHARRSFAEADGPDAFEIMRCIDEACHTNAIVVAYWTDPVRHARWTFRAGLVAWFDDEAGRIEAQGAWRETIVCPYDHHETIYSEPDYRIGIGRTTGSVMTAITTNGYFGAARDRIPISAIDTLESPHGDAMPPLLTPASRGRRLRVEAPVNMMSIRSGQYWAEAEGEQLADYIDDMRPRLMTGMHHLLDNKAETGTMSLRIMTNLDDDGTERRETSIYAHILSLAHQERWTSSHKTHLDIYRHAIAMNRKFKQDRQFVSWHEVFIVPSARFDYVNCHPGTGLLPYVPALEIAPRALVSGERSRLPSG